MHLKFFFLSINFVNFVKFVKLRKKFNYENLIINNFRNYSLLKHHVYLAVVGVEAGTWFLDLKNGNGATGKGESSHIPDATLTMDSKHFFEMFTGKFRVRESSFNQCTRYLVKEVNPTRCAAIFEKFRNKVKFGPQSGRESIQDCISPESQ